MNVSNYLSLIALFISLFTLYFTTLRGPKLSSATPNRILFASQPNGYSGIGTSLYIVNYGARPAHIEQLFVILHNPKGRKLKFTEIFECNLDMLIQLSFRENKIQKDAIQNRPFLISPSSHIAKDVVFQQWEKYNFSVGENILKFYALMVGKKKPVYLFKMVVRLNQEIDSGTYRKGKRFERVKVWEV